MLYMSMFLQVITLLSRFSTQELLVAHLSSWTSKSLKVTLSLIPPPPGMSCCPSREDSGTKSLGRVPATLAHRWRLLHCFKNSCSDVFFIVWDTNRLNSRRLTLWRRGSMEAPSTVPPLLGLTPWEASLEGSWLQDLSGTCQVREGASISCGALLIPQQENMDHKTFTVRLYTQMHPL